MTRARPALLLPIALGPLLLGLFAGTAAAGTAVQNHGTVIVFVADRVSFEELMTVPQFRAMAAAGGAALMATDENYRDDQAAVFEALGSGADPAAGQTQLLGRTLAGHGVEVCVLEAAGLSGLPPPAAGRPLRFLGVGANGDAACHQGVGPNPDGVLVVNDRFTEDVDRLGRNQTAAERARLRRAALDTEGKLVQLLGSQSPGGRVMLLVVTPSPSRDMIRVGDEVTPIIMVRSLGAGVFTRQGPAHGLRSDTTRWKGLVANVDVAPTILDFFGIEVPDEMAGNPIRIDGTADLHHLHRIHLEQRRIRLPLQLGEVSFVAFLGIVGFPLLSWSARGRELPRALAAAMRFLCVCGAALPIPLAAGGLLPRLTYFVVVPFLVLSIVALAAVAVAARWPGPLGPFSFLGAVGLAYLVLDALFGWRGTRVPLLGGTMFDGVRYFGLPNAFIPTLLASALFLALLVRPWPGFVLLVFAGLFAGFPSLGADLGGAATLFVAAGVWWPLRTRRRFGVAELAFALGVAALGVAVVLLANRYLPGAPTHLTGFVRRSGGLAGAWDEFHRRLAVGARQVRDVPAAWIPLLGLPVLLLAAVREWGPARSLRGESARAWRDCLIALTVGGMAAFFLNDTGVAAAAPAFLYAATVFAYPGFAPEVPGVLIGYE